MTIVISNKRLMLPPPPQKLKKSHKSVSRRQLSVFNRRRTRWLSKDNFQMINKYIQRSNVIIFRLK